MQFWIHMLLVMNTISYHYLEVPVSHLNDMHIVWWHGSIYAIYTSEALFHISKFRMWNGRKKVRCNEKKIILFYCFAFEEKEYKFKYSHFNNLNLLTFAVSFVNLFNLNLGRLIEIETPFQCKANVCIHFWMKLMMWNSGNCLWF